MKAVGVACVIAGLVVPLSSASAQTRLEAPNVPAIAVGWSIDTTPNRAGSPDTELFGVSCPDAAYCISVGYSEHDGDLVPLAEVWNATTWKKMIVPSPTDSPITYLYGVECVASNDCVAVGQYDYQASGVQDTLVEVWNGADWSIQASPDAAKAVGSYLYGVSCTAADACTAVGYSITPNQQILPLAEAWDGTSWTLQTTPRPAYSATKYSQTTYLYSVSCTGPDACVAVGFYEAKTGYNQPVSEVWNGTAWTLEYPVIPSGVNYGNHLYGVSCTGADSCTAVGYTDGGGTLVETWNADSLEHPGERQPGRRCGRQPAVGGLVHGCRFLYRCRLLPGWRRLPASGRGVGRVVVDRPDHPIPHRQELRDLPVWGLVHRCRQQQLCRGRQPLHQPESDLHSGLPVLRLTGSRRSQPGSVSWRVARTR